MQLAPKFILPILCIIFSSSLFASGDEKLIPEYMIVKNEKDPSLKTNEAVFVFIFNDIPISSEIRASSNHQQKLINTDSQGKYTYKTTPGKYIFQLFYNSEYFEIYTDTIKIRPGFRIEIEVNFQSSVYPVIMDKPVIYCYPKERTDIHIELGLQGKMLFTYPMYNQGWDITAYPDGTISANDIPYKYLFWEGETKINYQTTSWNEGSIVSKYELLSFMETSLIQMGMTSTEQQDFITYWYPLMAKNEKNYIHFVFNDEYNEYATININPVPDNMLRVYMLWMDATSVNESLLEKQKIPALKREGFTLVEWGGSELPYQPTFAF